MKKILASAMVAILSVSILAGCGKDKDKDATTGFSSIIEKIPEGDTHGQVAKTETVEEEKDPEGMVRNPLTNEWMDESLQNKRPIAVMYPINKEAMPQYGYDNIDVFYEIMEEDGMSRQMAIMQDWHGLDKIGNIRSTRDYFVYLSLEWDSILVHYGGPEVYCTDILPRNDVDNFNGVGGVMGPDYNAFFRVNPKNLAQEHTAYTDSERLEKAVSEAGFSTDHRDKYWVPEHYLFADKKTPNTLDGLDSSIAPGVRNATEIDLARAFPTTKPVMTYNAEDGKYYRNIYGEPQVDAESGNQLAFDNVIVQWTYYEVRDQKGYLAFKVHDAAHDGFFFTKGKMIHVTWQKTDDYEPTKYYYENGEEVQFNEGKTMVFVVQDDKPFDVNGATVQPATTY